MSPCRACPHPARLGLVLGLLLVVGCDAVGPVNEPPPPIPDTPASLTDVLANANGDAIDDFDDFALVAAEVGLETGATVLAPDDQAFSLMSPESLGGLRAAGVLGKTARRHVLTEPLDPASLADGDQLATLEGTPISVRVTDEGEVYLDGARLGRRIGSTQAGPVYRLERVLRSHLAVAERLAASPILSRSAELFDLARVDLSQPGTYLVPIDIGYDRSPSGYAPYLDIVNRALSLKILRALHIPGEPLTISQLRDRGQVETSQGSSMRITQSDGLTVLAQEARVLAQNIPADGAVIHLVDTPPQGHLTLMERIDFLPSTHTFSTLVRNAGLASTLDGPGPLTVFATTEVGFDSLRDQGRAALLTEAPLRDAVARFQIAPRDIPSAALTNGSDFETLLGQAFRVRPDPNRAGLLVLSQSVLTTTLDLPASNGRLHLTSSLLNPSLTAFDQLVLSGFGLFRAVARRVGYQPLLESDALVSIVGPYNLTEQYLVPGFECRARELVEDHLLPDQGAISPRSAEFKTLGLDSVEYSFDDRDFALSADTGGGLGRSKALSINFRMSNGGSLHGSEGRLRWYADDGPARALPRC